MNNPTCHLAATNVSSQLLDMLLELNSSLQLPHEFRYNVQTTERPEDREPISLDSANQYLVDAHDAVQSGQLSQGDFLELRESVEARLARLDVPTLSDLEREIPHTTYDPDRDPIPEHLADVANQIGFLTSAHEEDYLLRLDAKLGDQWSLSQPRPITPPTLTSLTAREQEREIELRNPQSVHNWLKKHNVSVADGDGERSEVGAPATSTKKAQSRNLAKKVGDRAIGRAREREDGSPMSAVAPFDEELGAELETPKNKGKKGRDADETYRPKGGSGKKAKRKREDGDGSAERKKARTSLATSVTGET